MINIAGLPKAKVLQALFNNSKQQGLGFLHHDGAMSMTLGEAEAITETRFDYLKGRVMKVNIAGDEFNPALYDRDNGEGAAQRAIDTIEVVR